MLGARRQTLGGTMTLEHRIDHARRLVIATGRGKLTDEDVFGYQRQVWSRDDVAGYDELVDMRGVESVVVPSTDRLKELVALAAGMDLPSVPSKFAIVAPDELQFDLARFFKAYRDLDPRSTKEVSVFKSMPAALDWLGRGDVLEDQAEAARTEVDPGTRG